MSPYTLVIPTAKNKYPWLQKTLFGFTSQTCSPNEIIIGLDTKPWDDDSEFSPHGKIIEVMPPRAFKRQHEIINTLVSRLSGPTVIVDDDYWLLSTNCMSDMLEKLSAGHMVVPHVATHASSGTMFDAPVLESGTMSYGSDFDGREVLIVDDGHGHNPFAGHPKLIMAEDFNSLGGFDYRSFPHYWWCDTDIWYRSRGQLEIVEADVPVMHFHHPRYKQEMFQQQNSKTFLARHGGCLSETHKRLLNVVIV